VVAHKWLAGEGAAVSSNQPSRPGNDRHDESCGLAPGGPSCVCLYAVCIWAALSGQQLLSTYHYAGAGSFGPMSTAPRVGPSLVLWIAMIFVLTGCEPRNAPIFHPVRAPECRKLRPVRGTVRRTGARQRCRGKRPGGRRWLFPGRSARCSQKVHFHCALDGLREKTPRPVNPIAKTVHR